MECFSVFENAWKSVAPLLVPVSSAAVVSCTGKLYVISGAVSDDGNTDKVRFSDMAYNSRHQTFFCRSVLAGSGSNYRLLFLLQVV